MSNPGESTLEHLIESTILTHETDSGQITEAVTDGYTTWRTDAGDRCACGWRQDDQSPAFAWQQYAAHLREQITTTIRNAKRSEP